MKILKIVMWIAILLILYITSPFLINSCYYDYTDKKLNNMIVVAHRGGASLAPENTLSCFRKGIESGADMIELDIHLTKDNQIVVCHDQTIDRMTTGKGKIKDLTLAEIRQQKIVDHEGHITTERIPTLQEVFSLACEYRKEGFSVNLLIEIKRTHNIYQGIEEKLVEMIRYYHASDWSVVQSFNDFALEQLHQIAPDLRLEKLAFYKFPFIPVIVDGTHISYFSYSKYNYVKSFNLYYRLVTPSLIKDIHNNGKEIKIWTIEKEYPKMDVDGIITNRPDIIKGNKNLSD